MKSEQYEELCRFVLSDKIGMPIDRIQSVRIPNPQRSGLPEYKHQIDLYWETENELSVYLHIANAKWRASKKVDQPNILLLHQVKQSVAAHKAMMITSSGFTVGAKAAAQDVGISLLIVKPTPLLSDLPSNDRAAIQHALRQIAHGGASGEPIYSYAVEYRALDGPEHGKPSTTGPHSARLPASETSVVGYTTRVSGGDSNRGGSPAGSNTAGGGSFTRGGAPSHGASRTYPPLKK